MAQNRAFPVRRTGQERDGYGSSRTGSTFGGCGWFLLPPGPASDTSACASHGPPPPSQPAVPRVPLPRPGRLRGVLLTLRRSTITLTLPPGRGRPPRRPRPRCCPTSAARGGRADARRVRTAVPGRTAPEQGGTDPGESSLAVSRSDSGPGRSPGRPGRLLSADAAAPIPMAVAATAAESALRLCRCARAAACLWTTQPFGWTSGTSRSRTSCS